MNEKGTERCNKLTFYQNFQNHNHKPPMQHFVSVNRTTFLLVTNHIRNERSNETSWWNRVKFFTTSNYWWNNFWERSGVLYSEKTCNELENLLTITTPLVALIITQGTSLPNAVEIKEATKIITPRKIE